MGLQLTSSSFQEGGLIPRQYTCDGQDVSPALRWANLPKGTRSLALIADDPDAPVGTWVHWVIFNIPSNLVQLPEGIPPKDSLPDGTRQGLNDFRRIGYGGPCPPPGKPHRYFFKLYALDTMLSMKPKATKVEVLAACKNHVLAEAQLMGRYARSR